MISVICRSSSVASLSSTIRSTVPPSLRTTRPRPVGSIASTETSAIAAWSMARASSSDGEQVRAHERHVTREDEDLRDLVVQHVEGGAQRVAGAARDVLERRVGALRDGVPDGLGRRRVDDERPRARRRRGGIEHVVDHRAAADPVEHLGRGRAHARAEAGGEHDGDGPAHGRAGTGRGHGTRRRGDRDRATAGGAARRRLMVRLGSSSGGLNSGVGRRGCQPAAGPGSGEALARAPWSVPAAHRDRLDLDQAALGRARRPATVDRAGGGSGMNRA